MIVTITSKRPGGVSHLHDTIRGIDASAINKKRVILVDGDASGVHAPEPWTVEAFRKPGGPSKANKWITWRAFELAAIAGEDLIFCEDDLSLCRNAARYMESFRVPDDVAFVSFYDPYHDINTPHGLWRSKMHVFSYCQCLKIPHRTCVELIAAAGEMNDNLRRGASDDCMQEIGFRRGWTYAIHVPSIVQHVGKHSGIGEQGLEGCRVSRSFFGPEFNARHCMESLYS